MSRDPIGPEPGIRLWPGVVAVALQWAVRFGAPVVVPGAVALAVFGGLLCALGVVLWWLFLSRAPRRERFGAVALLIVGLSVTYALNHESMGQLWLVSYATPPLCLAFVAWAAAGRRLSAGARRAALVATVVVACGPWTLVRSYGITGAGSVDFAWRWAATPEERLLAQAGEVPAGPGRAARSGNADPRPSPAALGDDEARWPGFRGPRRDGVVPGARIATDWSRSPPVELWRRPVGPGWSSFAVGAGLIYTQEQRGADEVVACYRSTTGEPVWMHRDAARFWESQASAGPRATPTLAPSLAGGRVYALGATGILNALDARDGAVVWSRDAGADTGTDVPIWGFSGSPLVTGDLVIVAASGTLAAYDPESGAPRWFGPARGVSYSSPHLMTIDGVEQVVLPHDTGVIGVAPADGTLLWEHLWPGFRIVQPALTADGDVLLASERNGTRRLNVGRGAGGWTVEERFTSNGLKPYFSDLVVHAGHAYGFDGGILACIDLTDGARRWKGGRYGHGQLLLLPGQDLLLVLSEQGELALVAAAPDGYAELARFQAIEGKTWNHPVLVGDLLLVRNSEELVAFRLRGAGG